MILPVALQTAAQSRFNRMQGTRCETSRSDRQASAQAVQVSTALKHASMQRLIASECAGFSGWERNMARTATADMACSFSAPKQNKPTSNWFRLLSILSKFSEMELGRDRNSRHGTFVTAVRLRATRLRSNYMRRDAGTPCRMTRELIRETVLLHATAAL